MGQAELLRAVLARDGSVKAVFDDNVVITVEPSGAAFTATLPNGDSVQQMSCYATRRQTPGISNFSSEYFSDLPISVEPLEKRP